MKKLIIENTYRSLLIYMLYDYSWKGRDYILVKGRISDEFISRFKAKVNSVSITDDFPIISIKSPLSSILTRLKFLKKIKQYEEIYGNVYELKLRKSDSKLIQLDDGLMTKKMFEGEYNRKITHIKFRNNFIFRRFLNVDYNFKPNNFMFVVPDSYKNNKQLSCDFINLRTKINNLSNDEYLNICEVYGFSPVKLNGKSILMLQPFFEDRLVSSIEYEINMYKEILKSEGLLESDIYIKPHPKSKVNYAKHFKGSEFIPKDFPYELLVRNSAENRFKKVISINSSGIEEFKDISEEVINFGTSNFTELDFSPMIRL